MSYDDPAQLELLSQLDALRERLLQLVQGAPEWQPAQTCRAMVRRLEQRIELMRVRWEAPLVVAVLGGSGTGKSALINALVGEEVVETGRRRPTTLKPALICRASLTPEMLGIDPADVELIVRDLPLLGDVVLVDCPDPDTTEVSAEVATTPEIYGNLARLHKILPHCDVLLVTGTQQKYRSARVAAELAAAASGARVIFVQTHADVDSDVREDWRAVLADHYSAGRMFFIDSLGALAEAKEGRQARGELAELMDLLSRELLPAARNRIRRANFLDLFDESLLRCQRRVDEAVVGIEQVENAVEQQRGVLAGRLAGKMREELPANRRAWENRLLGQVASLWGMSPFAIVLRIYQGLGNWALGALLLRARSAAQIAIWGTLEGVNVWRKQRRNRRALRDVRRAGADCWDQAELRKATLILDGYAAEAGLDRAALTPSNVVAEAESAAAQFLDRASAELDATIVRLAAHHTGRFTRFFYQLMLLAMVGVLLFRAGKNFFYDSWLAPHPSPVFGLDFYLTAAFWLVLWCLLLIAALNSRLRRGLRREIDQLTSQWRLPATASGLFARLEEQCRHTRRFREEIEALQRRVGQLRRELAVAEDGLAHPLETER